MAKKRTIVEETIPDTPQQTSDISLPSTWSKIKVYKIVPGVPEPRYCFQVQTPIDEEGLQNSGYGGGRYELRYCDIDGQVINETIFEVADKPQPQTPLTPEALQIHMLREQKQQTHELLMAVLGAGGKASTPMSEIAQMWGIMQGGGGQGGGMNLIDVFIKGLELGRKTDGGSGDWKSMLIDAGREVLPTVAAAVAAHGKQPIPPGMLPNVIHTNGNPPIPVPIQPTMDVLVKAGLQYMKPRILAGMPYDLALEWITTNANDPTYQPIVNFAMAKTFDDLVLLDPEIANEPYKTWFSNVLTGIKEHFNELAKSEDERE